MSTSLSALAISLVRRIRGGRGGGGVGGRGATTESTRMRSQDSLLIPKGVAREDTVARRGVELKKSLP